MSEPDYPYPKRPIEPIENVSDNLPPMPPEPPPSPPPPETIPIPTRFSCSLCGKAFNTREELTLHTQTTHQSPKKQV
ncbi:MAG: C2H2-type zinc finger protein [Candidatus Bathyarchaeota archaeon]|nr:C2H2-type zinc finger protein [Candidatus Bathyarchaeota archaeon]